MKKIVNSIMKNVVKVRVEGPLNESLQLKTALHLRKTVGLRTHAILVIINSYGGSLAVANNISDNLRFYITHEKIPVFCFAEQFCLNSANTILTTGSKCFANKLSMIGDFGFVEETYDLQEAYKRWGLSHTYVSNNEVQYEGMNPISKIKDLSFAEKLVQQKQKDLKKSIIRNRKEQFSHNKIDEKKVIEQILTGGMMKPKDAIENGLIDGLFNIEQFIDLNYADCRVNRTEEHNQYRIIQALRNLVETSKSE